LPGFQLTERQKVANRLLGSGARHILLRGGSRSGKTTLLVRANVIRAIKAADSRHAILRSRRTHIDASIWKDTLPKVMSMCFPGLPYDKSESDLTITLPNNSRIVCAGLDDKERVEKILGQEYATMTFNEISQISWSVIETSLTRLAQKTDLELRAYYDCNPPPKSHWSYQLWVKGLKPGTKEPVPDFSQYAEMRINPDDNEQNLPAEYFEFLNSMSASRRKRFRDGEWGEDTPDALWTADLLDRFRIGEEDYPEMRRVVVAVDPPVSSGDDADECGIVVAGIGVDGHGYTLADLSTKGQTPEGWARTAVNAYEQFSADRLVAEVNNGGELVESVIRQVAPRISYRAVRASRGKVTRAEPVSALYEQGKIHHTGTFEELEDQMVSFTSDFDPKEAGYSPDRVDALVWAYHDLMIAPRNMSTHVGAF
jgi:predicted phage terminase large subunit-like protein